MNWLWTGLGFFFFAIGAIGIVLPLWPTTIFWIIAVFCLAESHPKIRDWIFARPGIGPIIQDFVERGEIGRKGKIGAIGGMLLACAVSGWLLRSSALALSVLIISIAIGIVFVATRPSPESDAR
ncbi:MAG: YbaN family protein [Pseudomonadota bacterium]